MLHTGIKFFIIPFNSSFVCPAIVRCSELVTASLNKQAKDIQAGFAWTFLRVAFSLGLFFEKWWRHVSPKSQKERQRATKPKLNSVA
jgi:hypothetical protein